MLNERIVADLPLGILLLTPEGRVATANPAAQSLLSLAAGYENRDAASVLAGTPALAGVAARALDPGTARGTARVQESVAGEPRTLVVRWAPLEDGRHVVSIDDLTEIQDRDRRARQTATLTGVGRLANHLAHELKNPLGALKLYALLLSRQVRDGKASGGELAEKIARAVDQLSGLVSGLAGMGTPGALDLAPVVLDRVVDGALAGVEERIRSIGIELAREGQSTPVTVMADAGALQSAVAAVVRNAVDAMPDGGRLTLRGHRRNTAEVELTVQDSGPGMTPEVQAHLFEPFFTTKADGIGLGLVSARQVVEQHGGRVEVSSQTGTGTTVRVVLPASK
jgi:two-component system, NtrC family, sensor histidine kinase HydH